MPKLEKNKGDKEHDWSNPNHHVVIDGQMVALQCFINEGSDNCSHWSWYEEEVVAGS